jgi:DNA invertase Pin-like site-specific DNA recombinase
MLLGYARVSKSETQDTAAQVRVLREAGCQRIFQESASGGRWDRPELQRLLDQLRAGDTLVVCRLDRLSRSLKDLLAILERLNAAGAQFRSLTEAVDTTGPAGRMLMQMLGAFAEFEREMIRERTRAGLSEARAKGRLPGRKSKVTAEQQREIVEAVLSGRKTAAEMARLFKLHPATVSRLVSRARMKVEIGSTSFTREFG